MKKDRVTGMVVPRDKVHYVKCVEGHIAPHEESVLLSKDGAVCPFCRERIVLSSDDKRLLMVGTDGLRRPPPVV
ncbi:MAG: hypothetical protein A3D65_00535 [Candidatus Lloydbacteria bacterium RIFCSPHIGHO2_02_FULL_50_13]|uniref:Uncharacterized protein n=1 Tax=Candidatus Lloydbacteria bacterium RIFCSPHIGHO2_02_FULL_50_13 TaxID=1798661 RepID=A0A1G2D8J2_9BACT|nr:MAG: hypothetical protein A3D65_00535 [Candidatus Lloydbacteria bacterium RIFCSPHIGHO2_02_FULL_50_13]